MAILTDIELLEVRYTGRAASVMRMLNSVFYGMFASIMFLGPADAVDRQDPGGDDRLEQAHLRAGHDGLRHQLLDRGRIVGRRHVGFVAVRRDLRRLFDPGRLCRHAIRRRAGGFGARLRELNDTWPQGADLHVLPSQGPLGLSAMTLVALFMFRWIEQAGMGQYVAQRLIATKDSLSAVYAAMIWGVGFFAIVPVALDCHRVCCQGCSAGLRSR